MQIGCTMYISCYTCCYTLRIASSCFIDCCSLYIAIGCNTLCIGCYTSHVTLIDLLPCCIIARTQIRSPGRCRLVFDFLLSVREMKNNMCWQHWAWTPKKALMSDEWNLLGDEFCERRCCASLVNIMLPAFGEIAKKGRKFENFF